MASIKFILKSPTSPAGIYVRLTDGKPVDVMAKTKYSIDPADWSKSKEQPKNLKQDYFKNLNAELTDLKADLLKHYNNSRGNIIINTQWLKEFLQPTQKPTDTPSTLAAYFEVYTAEKKKHVSANSLKKYNVVKNKVVKLEEELKGYSRTSERVKAYDNFLRKYELPIKIKDVNRDFQAVFEAFSDRHKYAHNTITMELRFIKTVCRHASGKDIEVHKDLEKIENRYEATQSIYLNPEDLSAIKKLNDLPPYLDNARDWLLISCNTGQRVSDFLRFSKDMIRQQKANSGKTITLIEFTQAKTGKRMTLPLNEEVIGVLDKRDGEFPSCISDVKYNLYIKKVCKRAGLTYMVEGSLKSETEKDSGIYRMTPGTYEKWELVSSHIGRRSFATNYHGKIPTSLLIAATGHSTEQMFLKYIGKSNSDRALELAEYF